MMVGGDEDSAGVCFHIRDYNLFRQIVHCAPSNFKL